MMVRLPPRGSTIATPARPESELGDCLADLGVSVDQEMRLETRWVAEALISISQQLDRIGTIFNAHATGLHSAVDIEIVSQVTEYLVLDPSVGSIAAANDLIASFVESAATIAYDSMIAGTELSKRSGKRGRSSLEWYDDFTALTLKIAAKVGEKPTLYKDRISSEPRGWLLDVARMLESFLLCDMRSPSAEACAKRLERSKRRLADDKN
jgi:hypothetical protein